MIMPRVSRTVAYDGHPFSVLDFPTIDGHPHIELSRCPGTIRDPNAGWHEGWQAFDSIFVPLEDFLRSKLSGISVN